jgi:hypothetical protein
MALLIKKKGSSDDSANAGRRHFLRGAGGAVLALPVLPSLYATDAHAQSAATQRSFVLLRTEHGGAYQRQMFPAQSTITERQMYAGHEIRRGVLTGSVANGETRLSDVLRAPSSALSASIIAKMNVVNGIDVPFSGLGHNRCVALGNFADNYIPDEVDFNNRSKRMSIDQIMAWSPSFYPDLTRVKERSISNGISWNWSNPATRTGTLQAVFNGGSNIDLFDKLFGSSTPGAARTPIVDRVIEDYRRTLNNPRLSTNDKRRVTEHMDRLAELQRKLQIAAAGAVPARPTINTNSLYDSTGFAINPDRQAQFQQLRTDIIVAAFNAGATRIFAERIGDDFTFSTTALNWHQEIAHLNESSASANATLIGGFQTYFSRAVLDLVNKLNAVSNGVGGTLLDNSLVTWTTEYGHMTHETTSIPFITFGSAAGWLRTGQYLDYRNLTKQIYASFAPLQNEPSQPGLLIHQWLGTTLQAMGIPKSQYENLAQNGGYPDFNNSSLAANMRYKNDTSLWPSSVWSLAGEPLPWLKV